MADEITAATRWEKLLSEVLGEDYAVIPVTRIEKFLANILGEEYDLIPVTRIEKLLAKIAEEGGSGGGDENLIFALIDYQNTSPWMLNNNPVGNGTLNPIPAGGQIVITFRDTVPLNEYGNIIGINKGNASISSWTDATCILLYLGYNSTTGVPSLTIRSKAVNSVYPIEDITKDQELVIKSDGIYFNGELTTAEIPDGLIAYQDNNKGLTIGSYEGSRRFGGVLSVRVLKG